MYPQVLVTVSCVFLFTFFSVFAEGVFVNAKMNFQVKKHGKYFGIYENYFSKNTKNKEIKRHKTQDTRHKTQDTTCMSRSATKSCVLCFVSYVFLFPYFSFFCLSIFHKCQIVFRAFWL